MSYADKLSVPFVILVGEDEIAENVVSVKDMTSGKQEKMSAAAAADYINQSLSQRRNAPVIK